MRYAGFVFGEDLIVHMKTIDYCYPKSFFPAFISASSLEDSRLSYCTVWMVILVLVLIVEIEKRRR